MKFELKSSGKWLAILAGFILLLCTACQKADKPIVGVKIYNPPKYWPQLISQWKVSGINTAFAGIPLFEDEQFRTATKKNNISSFVIVPIFFNPALLKKSPENYAITAKGEKAQDEWVQFVCPSRRDFRRQKINEIEAIIRDYDPDCLSLDFVRHFVFWEKVYPDRAPSSLPNTCFDDSCLNRFQAEMQVSIPNDVHGTIAKATWIHKNCRKLWTQWKCDLITSMVADISVAAKKLNPEIAINIHIVPWAHNTFDGATKSVAGQDLAALSAFANFLSPMTYTHMIKRPAEWIGTVVRDVDQIAENKVIPSIQVSEAYLNSPLTNEEFNQTLMQALKPPSRGVIFWSWEKLQNEPAKLEILKTALAGHNR